MSRVDWRCELAVGWGLGLLGQASIVGRGGVKIPP